MCELIVAIDMIPLSESSFKDKRVVRVLLLCWIRQLLPFTLQQSSERRKPEAESIAGGGVAECTRSFRVHGRERTYDIVLKLKL